ncbi:MAG: SGNH/GDSL hydrolase family protein [Acidobacteria bacterium]|nr:SGNH/GDSL hydrolase family protein [Acidobacteriota bacterium]
MSMIRWQTKFWAGAAFLLPFAPALYIQGQFTRKRVGVLPGASGDTVGVTSAGDDPASLFVIGESTVAGLGARTHQQALAGQFAIRLAERIERPVKWTVLGKNGVTARRTIDELVPNMPKGPFDYILVALGGNDVLKISSPKKWRNDMTEFLGILREANPDAKIFLANCPMIKASTAIPQPIRAILWELSKMHDENIKEFTADMEQVYYYHQPRELEIEGFFADGIHPSERGYSDWTEAMMKFFVENYKW